MCIDHTQTDPSYSHMAKLMSKSRNDEFLKLKHFMIETCIWARSSHTFGPRLVHLKQTVIARWMDEGTGR